MKDINTQNLQLTILFRGLFATIILFYTFQNQLFAQKIAKPINSEDYSKWSTAVISNVSPDRNWVSYLSLYESFASKRDILNVKSLMSSNSFAFPGSRYGLFFGDQFVCMSADTLIIQNLKNGKKRQVKGVSEFKLTSGLQYLLIVRTAKDKLKTIAIEDVNGRTVKELNAVEKYQLSNVGDKLIYSRLVNNSINLSMLDVEIPDSEIVFMEKSAARLSVFKWKNNLVAFTLQEKDSLKLYAYNIKNKQLILCPFDNSALAREKMAISSKLGFLSDLSPTVLSDDGTKVFFKLSEPMLPQVKEQNVVEIWNTKDKRLYDRVKGYGSYPDQDKLAVWNIASGDITQITSKKYPSAFLNGSYSHAFVYDEEKYEPQNDMHAPLDIYAIDLNTGEQNMIAEKINDDYTSLPSPNGQFFAYYQNGRLWVYDLIAKSRMSIMEDKKQSLFNQSQNKPNNEVPYKIAGYSSDSRYLLVYDQYDIWQVELASNSAQRLTMGREKGQVFRISKLLGGTTVPLSQLEPQRSVSMDEGLILSARNTDFGFSGFYWWERNKQLIKIVWEDKQIEQVAKIAKGKYIYLQQRFDSPPAIIQIDEKGKKQIVVQTNLHHQQYEWGKADIIYYTYKGKQLSGVLFTPPGYQKGKKYPMIVSIYENQSFEVHNFVRPDLISGIGINVPHLLAQGYFILLPNISYEIGKLGESVTGSVLAAVDSVVAKGYVDNNRVGLTGHSFGGYETDLIITQTNRFAAAVAGAPFTDLVSAYLYVGASLKIPDFYRAEYDQLRIGKSLYEDMNSYLKNSPVLLAEKVSTPLLGWTGKEDRHVNALQSFEFYLALRRLGKEHTLLVYPGEPHQLYKKASNEDLTNRVAQWFGHYLKGEEPAGWIKKDVVE